MGKSSDFIFIIQQVKGTTLDFMKKHLNKISGFRNCRYLQRTLRVLALLIIGAGGVKSDAFAQGKNVGGWVDEYSTSGVNLPWRDEGYRRLVEDRAFTVGIEERPRMSITRYTSTSITFKYWFDQYCSLGKMKAGGDDKRARFVLLGTATSDMAIRGPGDFFNVSNFVGADIGLSNWEIRSSFENLQPGTKYFIRGQSWARNLEVDGGDPEVMVLSKSVYFLYTKDKCKGVTLLDPASNNLETVRFKVTFFGSEDGLNKDNFEITGNTGNLNPVITSVSGGGSDWTVSVKVSGTRGTLGLKLANDNNTFNYIENVGIESSQYTINRGVTSITRLDPDKNNYALTNYKLTFDGAISALTASNFSFTTTNGVKASVATLAPDNGQTSSATWTMGVKLAEGTYGMVTPSLVNTDGINPTVGGLPFKGDAVTIARGFPVISKVEPLTGKPGDKIKITGSGFIQGQDIFFFGNVRAEAPVFKSATEYEVTVPFGAPMAPVSVQNNLSALLSYSPSIFNITNDRDDSSLRALYLQRMPDFNLAKDYNPRTVRVADVNSDGYDDLVLSVTANKKILVLVNNKKGGFNTPIEIAVSTGNAQPYLAIGDVTGDGKPDIITTSTGTGVQYLLVYPNLSTQGGTAAFGGALQTQIAGTVETGGIDVADLDKDGRTDIIVGLNSGKVYIYPNYTPWPGSTLLLRAPVTLDTGKPGIKALIAGDVDGDQKPDLIVANYGTDAVAGTTVTVFKNSSSENAITTASFGAGTVLAATGSNPSSLALGDIDGDGKSDLVVQGSGTDIIVLRNTGTGFQTAVKQSFALSASGKGGEVSLRDLDGDGKPEIISAVPASGTLVVFRNKSVSGTIDAGSLLKSSYRAGTGAQSAVAADFDNDGKGDVVVANPDNFTLSLFRYIAPPVITSFSPLAANANGTVTITGKLFNTDKDKNIVYFGAARASVVSATAEQLVVTVPEGSTFGPITILDAVSGLSGQSSESFGAVNGDDQIFFSSRNDYEVQGSAQYMLAADLDNDGYPELISVAPATAGSKLIVSKNSKGESSFKTGSVTSSTVSIAGSGNVSAIASGDLNGDGSIDIVAADYDKSRLFILLNTEGTLSQSADIALTGKLSSVKISDIDGDGKQDIITTDKTGNNVFVLRNVTTEKNSVSFEQAVNFPAGTAPSGLVVRDLDADGRPEIVTANSGSSNVTVLRNLTSGSSLAFAEPQHITTAEGPAFVDAADVDGDNKPELAVVNPVSNSVSVLKNTSVSGTVSFELGANIPAGNNPSFLAFGDLNADGKMDMVVTNPGSNTISVYENKAANGTIDAASFAKSDYAAGQAPASVVIADLNKNGRAEIAVSNKTGNSVSVFQNLIPPVVTSVSPASGAPGTPGTQITISGKNFNETAENNVVYFGAVRANVISASKESIVVEVPAGATDRTISVLDKTSGLSGFSSSVFAVTNGQTDGSYSFRTAYSTEEGASPQSVTAADIDGDGRPDLVSVDPSGKIFVSLNTGSAAVASGLLQNYTFTADPGVSVVRTSDIDGDGKLDLVLANPTNNKIYVLLNTSSTGSVTFATPQSFIAGINPSSLAVADLDSDGKPDIIATGVNSDVATVLRNISLNGTVLFESSYSVQTGSKPSFVTVRDLNNDGKPEIITANAGEESNPGNTISVLYNQATPGLLSAASFTAQTFNAGSRPSSITVSDLNGDGLSDLAVTSASENKVYILKNISAGSSINFDAAVSFGTGANPVRVVAGDVNGDNRPDLAVLNATDNTVSVLLNTDGTISANSFSKKQDYAAGSKANSLAIADLNKDGKAEIAVANSTGTISIMRYMPVPVIMSVNPAASPVYSNVTITGRNFNTDPSKNIVFFGATKATVLNATASVLTVQAPAEATYSFVSVLDAETGLSAYSSEKFILSNPNIVDPELKVSSFDASHTYAAQDRPVTVALGDFDGDGKSDLAVISSTEKSLTVFHNESQDGSLASSSFSAGSSAKFSISGDAPKSIAINDIDGDGKLDVVVGQYKRISVFRNTATAGSITAASFAAAVEITAKADVNMIAINDMNGDGRPDVISANAGESSVSVFRNVSTPGHVAFGSSRADYTVGGNPLSVTTADLNGDGKPELISANEGSNGITVLPNTAGAGTFNTASFGTPVQINTGAGVRSVAAGDLNGDGKADLALIRKGQNFASVFQNTSSSEVISFGEGIQFATGETPYGVSIGDINGDKKADLVTGNLQSVSVIRNVSQNGALTTASFAPRVDIKTSSSPQVVAIGDLDNNATAELVVTNEFLNSLTVISTKITAKITFEALADKVYGDGDFAPGATSNTNGVIVYKSSNEAVASIVDNKIHIVGAGETVITASLSENANYAAANEVSVPFKVAKKGLSIVAASAEKKYGKVNPKFNYSITGFVNNETVDVLDVLPVLTAVTDPETKTPVEVLTKVGVYPVVLTNTPLDNNYSFTYQGDNLTIRKATLVAKADNVAVPVKIDGNTWTDPQFTITYSGWVGDDNESTYTFDSRPVAAPATGVDYTVKGSYPLAVTGGLDKNYEFSYVPGTLDIGKNVTVLTAGTYSDKTYGDAPFSIDVTTSNTESEVLKYQSLTPDVVTVNPTNGTITVSGTGKAIVLVSQESTDNYQAKDLRLEFVVNKKQLTASVKDATKVYGKDMVPLVVDYSGFAYNENKSVINKPAVFTALESTETLVPVSKTTPVRSSAYPVVALDANKAFDDNYYFEYTQGNLNVVPAALIVKAADAERVYGDGNPVFSMTYSGFVNNESESTPGVISEVPQIGSAAGKLSAVGEYEITISGGIANNYEFKAEKGKLTVKPAVVNVSVTDANGGIDMQKDYGQDNPLFKIHYSGFKNEQDESVLTTPAVIPSTFNKKTSAGSYIVAAAGASAPNYTFSYQEDAKLTVNKINLNVRAKDASRLYGAENPVFEFEYSSLIEGDTEADIDLAPTAVSAGRKASVISEGYPITLTGGSDNNYNLQLQNTGKLIIVPAPLTVRAEKKNRKYGEANPPLTVAYEYFVNGDTENDLIQKPVLTTDAKIDDPNGDYLISFATDAKSNNYVITQKTDVLSVGQATLVISIAKKTRKYGAANPVFTITYDGFLNSDGPDVLDVKPVVGVAPDVNGSKGVGKYPIMFTTHAVSSKYQIEERTEFLEITKAPLFLEAEAKSRPYNTENPVFTLKKPVLGLVNNETVETALTKQPVLASNAVKLSPVNSEGYDIYFQEEAESDNYDISYFPAKLMVSKAVPEISFGNIADALVYGDNDILLAATSTNAEDAVVYKSGNTAVATVDNGVFHIAGAGTVTIRAEQAETANYSASYTEHTIVIKKADLTATAVNKSREYGDENPSFDFEFSGYKYDDSNKSGVLSTQPLGATTATHASPVGDYPIVVTGGESANYNIIPVSATLTIAPAPLAIGIRNETRRYGEENPSFTFTYEVFKNGETPETPGVMNSMPVATTTADISSPFGTYPVTISGAAALNYSITYDDGELSVIKAVLTAMADDKSKVYGDENPQLTISYTGFKNGENETTAGITKFPQVSTTVDKSTPVGTYDIEISDDAEAVNYDVDVIKGTIKVSQAELTVTAQDAAKTYGMPNPELTVSYSGFKNGEDESVLDVKATAVTEATFLSGAGTYPIVPKGAADANYAIKPVSGTLTVGQARLRAEAENKSRTYGDNNPVFTAKYSGFVNGDSKADIDVLPSISTVADNFSAVGTYPIIVAGGSDNNYILDGFGAQLEIRKANLVVKADNKSRALGVENPKFTFTYFGFANNEGPDVIDTPPALTTNATVDSPEGEYDILISGALDNNYEVKHEKGRLTIGLITPDITVKNIQRNFTYGDADFSLNAVSENTVTPLVYFTTNPEVLSVDENGKIHINRAGNATIRVSQPAGNSYGSANEVYVDLVIARAPLEIRALDAERNFGQENPEFFMEYHGFVNGENEAVLSASAIAVTNAQKFSAAGVYPINVTNAASNNYEINSVAGKLTVKPISASMNFADIPAKTYGDADFKVAVMTNNTETPVKYSSDNTGVATVDDQGMIHIVGAGTTILRASQDPSASFNVAMSTSTVLTVNKKQLKIVADNKSKKYMEENPVLTFTADGLVNGEDKSVVEALVILTTNAVKESLAGPYTIQVALNGVAPNYQMVTQIGALIVNPANSMITFGEIPVKKFGDPEFKVNAATSSTEGTLRYSIKNASSTYPAASIDPVTGKVAILNAGTAIITATVINDDNYDSGQDISQQLTVIKATPVITLPDPGTKTYGDAEFSLNAKSTNTITPLVYSSSNASVATVSAGGMVTLSTGGYTNVKADQVSTNNYESATASVTLFVNKKVPTIVLKEFDVKTYGDAPFSPVVTGSTAPVKFYSSNSKVAVIADGQIVITGAGSTTITAVQDQTPTTAEASNSKNLQVDPSSPVISVADFPADRVYGDADVQISAVSNITTVPLVYSSSNPAVASIVNGKLHITGAGTTTVTVSQAESSNYKTASVQKDFTVGKATITVTAADKERVVGTDNPVLTATYSGFKYAENEAVFEAMPQISTTALKGSAAGIYPITAHDAADDNYKFEYKPAKLVVLEIGRITFDKPADKTYGDGDFKLMAGSNNANVPMVFRGDNPSVATVDQYGNVHIVGSGKVNVTVSQARDAAYTAAEDVTQTLTVIKKRVMVTADDKVAMVGTLPAFTVTYSGWANNESLTVLTKPAVATVATNGADAGEFRITASGAAAANYEFDYTDGKLILTTDGLSFLFDPMPVKTYLDADFDPGAKTNTKTAVYYSSNNPAVAVIVDNKVRIVGAGSAEITATVRGIISPEQDLHLKQTLTVNKARQVITFQPMTGVVKDQPYQMVASSSSGLPVTYVSSNSWVGSVEGSMLMPQRLGSGTVTVSQEGNKDYLPAENVTLSFVVENGEGPVMIVPKALTPNGDGVNDVLYIEGITEYPQNQLSIFNRNGVRVFDVKNYNNGSVSFQGKELFGGTARGMSQLLPQGTYFYVLSYKKDGKSGEIKGFFVLKY